jgi:hypothetical protein
VCGLPELFSASHTFLVYHHLCMKVNTNKLGIY